MYMEGDNYMADLYLSLQVVKYMADFYPPDFTYQQFGPQFRAEFFNATEWATLGTTLLLGAFIAALKPVKRQQYLNKTKIEKITITVIFQPLSNVSMVVASREGQGWDWKLESWLNSGLAVCAAVFGAYPRREGSWVWTRDTQINKYIPLHSICMNNNVLFWYFRD